MAIDWDLIRSIDWSKIETPEAWETLVRERFPAFAWALDHEELGPILEEAAKGDYTEQTFSANLRATEWWTSRTEAQRSWDLFSGDTTNAAEVARRVEEAKGSLSDQISTLGVEVPAAALDELTRQWLRNGWNEDELIGAVLAESTDFNPGVFTATESAVKQMGADFMVSVSDSSARSLAQRMIRGEVDEVGIEETMRELATQQHPALADLIERGVTPSQYFAPHRTRIATALGRQPEDIDLMGEFSDVLSIGDGREVRPMTVTETDRYLKSKDEYWQVPGGEGEAQLYGMVSGLAGAFGRRR